LPGGGKSGTGSGRGGGGSPAGCDGSIDGGSGGGGLGLGTGSRAPSLASARNDSKARGSHVPPVAPRNADLGHQPCSAAGSTCEGSSTHSMRGVQAVRPQEAWRLTANGPPNDLWRMRLKHTYKITLRREGSRETSRAGFRRRVAGISYTASCGPHSARSAAVSNSGRGAALERGIC
jgi:hypothetical protein